MAFSTVTKIAQKVTQYIFSKFFLKLQQYLNYKILLKLSRYFYHHDIAKSFWRFHILCTILLRFLKSTFSLKLFSTYTSTSSQFFWNFAETFTAFSPSYRWYHARRAYPLKCSVVDFFRLINHRLNWSLKNRFFSIFGIFDHTWLIGRWSKNQFFYESFLLITQK